MKIKIANVESVGAGDNCEIYVTVKCDEQAKVFLLEYLAELKEMMPSGYKSKDL